MYQASEAAPEYPTNERPQIRKPSDAMEYMRGWIMDDREVFQILMLDASHRLIRPAYAVAVGTLDSCAVHPREVFKPAIANSCKAIIIAHNHPSGTLDPSRDDIELTHRLEECGELLGIPVLDHIILNHGSWNSLLAGGHMKGSE